MILNRVKKVAVMFIACLGMVMLWGQLVEAQWTKINLPYGKYLSIYALVSDGNKIFAGTDVGLFCSSDSGLSWKPTIMNYGAARSVTVYEGNIFAGFDEALFRSSDDGISWIVDSSGLAKAEMFFSLTAIDSNLIIAGTGTGIFRSFDSGKSWDSDDAGITALFQGSYSLAVIDSNIFVGTRNGVYILINRGPTWWVATDSGLSGLYVNALCVNRGIVFAGTSSGIFQSEDTGKSWVADNYGLPGTPEVNAIAVSGSSFFAGLNDSVYRSLDSGKTWSFVNSNGGGNTFAISGGKIMVGGIGGFRYSTDGGTTWTSSNTGLNGYLVNSFEVYGSTILAGSTAGIGVLVSNVGDIGVPYPTGTFRSTDNGNSWTKVNDNGGSAFAVSGGTLFSAGGGLYSSKDSGVTWTAIDTAVLGLTFSVLFADGAKLLAIGYTGDYGIANTFTMFRSTDGGKSWNGDTSGLPYSQLCEGAIEQTCYSNYTNVQSFADLGNTFFAGLAGGSIYRSIDTGTKWTIDSSIHTNSTVQCFATNGSILFAGTANSGVFISKDTGTTWTASNSGLTNTNIQALFATGADLFAGTHGGGIFHSSDSGKSWTPFNNGLTDSSIQSFGVNDTYLFAGVGPGTYGGSVWRYPLSQVSVKRAQQIRPELASLKLHSTGRFNPAVSIDFSIPSPEKVSIGIYDLCGHLVTQLDDKLFTAGQHTLQWNARNAGSGCYVVRMQAGGSVQVRAVPVVRQ